MVQKLSQKARDLLLSLHQNPKIGSKALRKILHLTDNHPEKIFRQPSVLTGNFSKDLVDLILSSQEVAITEDELKSRGIGVLTMFDDNYPQLLLEISDPPVLLYYRGNVAALQGNLLAIVGSRKHTYYAKIALDRVIPSLISAGLSIVSGLALGVDGLAHLITLDNSGVTIAVLGSGVERIYPLANKKLADRMLVNKGLIISEFPPRTPPLKQNFPLRNRIIAGLTLGTLVVEARCESGSLITANLANEYNREVFAVPANIDSPASEGSNALIKMGAKLVANADDILQELGFAGKNLAEEIIPSNEIEAKILACLESQPLAVDKIAKITNLDIVTVNSTLSIMEIAGKVENTGGGFRIRGKLKQKQGEK